MKKIKSILLLITTILALNGCSSLENNLIPTYNKGGYKIIINNKKTAINSEEINISGKVFDATTGKPISNVELTATCIKTNVSSQGEYSFRTKKSSYKQFYIKVNSFGYKTIETNFIDLTNNIEVNFYLAEDDRPLINCEGIIN